MTWDKGFDFRASSSYVTDPTDSTYVLTTDSYPTTRNGVTFGYSTLGGTDSRDRSTTVNARLAGMHFQAGADSTFRVDLPATGDYDVYAALGEASNAQTMKVTFKDTSTAFITITNSSTGGSNHYLDATVTDRTEAQWLADSTRGGTKVTRTFASTILNVLNQIASSNSSCIAHIFLHQVGGGGGGTTDGTLSSSGTGSATFIGASLFNGVLSSSGVGAANFIGASLFKGVFSSSGVGTAIFSGIGLNVGTFNSVGVSVATFTGKANSIGIFSSAGLSSVTFSSAAFKSSPLVAAATNVTLFGGNAIELGSLTAAALSSVSFIGGTVVSLNDYFRRYLNDRTDTAVPGSAQSVSVTAESSLSTYFRKYLNDKV